MIKMPTNKDWERLEFFLINQMIKLSGKQIREYKFTVDQLPDDLAMFKKVKWMKIQKWIKKEWTFRKSTKVEAPFLDLGHWVKFKW